MDFESVKNVIAENLGCDMEKITMDARLAEDLGADSLDAVELVMALEEAADVTIEDEDAAKLKTVADIMNFLNAQA